MRYFILLSLLFLVSCASLPKGINGLPFKYNNDCLPQAITMTENLRKNNIDADVLIIYTEKWSHAVCCYMYPKGQNKLWCWDQDFKSVRVRAWREIPRSIAYNWLKETFQTDPLKDAEFLK